MGVKNLTPLMADRVSRQGKRKTVQFQAVCVDHCILLLQHLSNHMHFLTNGYRCFSKTNSTDPRQRVPLITALANNTRERRQERQFNF